MISVSATAASFAALLAAAPILGCGADTPDAAAETAPAAEAAPAAERLPDTPEGGLREWVAEIRTGVEGLGRQVTEDPDAAEKTAVDLYVGRQEFLERYWGTYGVFARDAAPALGQAVMDAEARFHELLILLAGSEPPPAARVDSMVSLLDAQLARVLEEAERANVPLVPPAASHSATSSDSMSR